MSAFVGKIINNKKIKMQGLFLKILKNINIKIKTDHK